MEKNTEYMILRLSWKKKEEAGIRYIKKAKLLERVFIKLIKPIKRKKKNEKKNTEKIR